MSQLFASGGQDIKAALAVLSKIIQGWFSLALTGLLSLLSKGLTRENIYIYAYCIFIFLFNNLYKF